MTAAKREIKTALFHGGSLRNRRKIIRSVPRRLLIAVIAHADRTHAARSNMSARKKKV
jgi:hypothetical protein